MPPGAITYHLILRGLLQFACDDCWHTYGNPLALITPCHFLLYAIRCILIHDVVLAVVPYAAISLVLQDGLDRCRRPFLAASWSRYTVIGELSRNGVRRLSIVNVPLENLSDGFYLVFDWR